MTDQQVFNTDEVRHPAHKKVNVIDALLAIALWVVAVVVLGVCMEIKTFFEKTVERISAFFRNRSVKRFLWIVFCLVCGSAVGFGLGNEIAGNVFPDMNLGTYSILALLGGFFGFVLGKSTEHKQSKPHIPFGSGVVYLLASAAGLWIMASLPICLAHSVPFGICFSICAGRERLSGARKDAWSFIKGVWEAISFPFGMSGMFFWQTFRESQDRQPEEEENQH